MSMPANVLGNKVLMLYCMNCGTMVGAINDLRR